jgi:hypothetical protein
MSREKQIEEMAKDILKCGCVGTCLECEYATLAEDDCACIDVKIAEGLYNAGYRKASDVAEEIFAEIEHTARAAIILLKFEKDEKLRNTKTECYEDLLGYIAELKKKYTEGE